MIMKVALFGANKVIEITKLQRKLLVENRVDKLWLSVIVIVEVAVVVVVVVA